MSSQFKSFDNCQCENKTKFIVFLFCHVFPLIANYFIEHPQDILKTNRIKQKRKLFHSQLADEIDLIVGNNQFVFAITFELKSIALFHD